MSAISQEIDRQKPISESKTRLLWVDDRIASFSGHIREMELSGIEVVTAEDTKHAKEIVLNDKNFDFTFIDLLLPPDGGVELLREFTKIIPNTKKVVLSSYTDIDVLEDGLDAFEKVKVIPKSLLPEFKSQDFLNNFIPALLKNRLQQYEQRDKTKTHSLFDLSIDDFINKSFSEKIQLNSLVRGLVEKELKQHFDNGKIWVLICGNGEEVIATATKVSDIWSEKDVMKYCKSAGKAPYQFTKQIDVDDLGWATSCSDENGTRDYPTVTLKFGNDRHTVHFDTGNPLTLVDRNYYHARNLVSSVLPIEGSTTKGPYWGTEFRQTGLILDQKDEGSKKVNVIGVAVESWEGGQFSRNCPSDCGKDGPYRSDCKFRTGLIGRNLLIDNDLSIILDGKSAKTRLIDE